MTTAEENEQICEKLKLLENEIHCRDLNCNETESKAAELMKAIDHE